MSGREIQELHWLLDIIQNTDIGIVVLDSDLSIEVYNRFMQVHSNISAEQALGANLFELFPYLEDDWFVRRVRSVFELGVPIYSTWEQKDNVFDFYLSFPLNHQVSLMYQNATFIPLHSVRDEVDKIAIVIYDVTDTAVSNLRLREASTNLLRLSRTDRLSGLNNRGYWEECLQAEFRRWQRSQEDISLVIFDIDHFKQVNDTYGHHVGDQMIVQVAETLLSCCREVDICGRYGGEEYVVLLPSTDEAGARVFAERLRNQVAQLSVDSEQGPVSCTVSLGIAGLTDRIKAATAWLVCADKALYQAKTNGRNQTVIYTVE